MKREYRKIIRQKDTFVEGHFNPNAAGSVDLDGTQYSVVEVLESLNYGCEPLFTKLSLAWSARHDISQSLNDIWDSALIAELALRLLGTDRAIVFRSYGFENMIRREDNNILFRTLKRFSEAYNANILIPRVYVLLEISEFVLYLRDTVQSGTKSTKPLPEEFEDKRKQLRGKLIGGFEQKHCSNCL